MLQQLARGCTKVRQPRLGLNREDLLMSQLRHSGAL